MKKPKILIITYLKFQYKVTGKGDNASILSKLSTKESHFYWQFSYLAAGLKALDVDAEVVVGVVGEGGVSVEDEGHGGGIQVARICVHLQLQLGALWLPIKRLLSIRITHYKIRITHHMIRITHRKN